LARGRALAGGDLPSLHDGEDIEAAAQRDQAAAHGIAPTLPDKRLQMKRTLRECKQNQKEHTETHQRGRGDILLEEHGPIYE